MSRLPRSPFAHVSSAWARYKVGTLKIALAAAAVLAIGAQLIPSFNTFVSRNGFLTVGGGIALLFLLVDTLLSGPASGDRRDSRHPSSLSSTSDLRDLLPWLAEQDRVEICIASYSSETFYGVLSPLLDDIAEGRTRVRSVTLRLLTPDCRAPMGMPCVADTGLEDPSYKRYLVNRTDRFVREFGNYFERIAKYQPRIDASFSHRSHRMTPVFKVALLQRTLSYHGIYPIDLTPISLEDQGEITMLDFRGERARMIRSDTSIGDATEQEMHRALETWFETVWEHSKPVQLV